MFDECLSYIKKIQSLIKVYISQPLPVICSFYQNKLHVNNEQFPLYFNTYHAKTISNSCNYLSQMKTTHLP